ncbi:MAG: tripartite tricarboxylate transporter TctB family protein [Deltaproteobacteria bacterium]|nr:tripartite tricarboxylate transporter TctB family protein [Deltaproteobacteria bacterium]
MEEERDKTGVNPNSRFHDLFTAVLGGFAAFLLATIKMQIDTTAVPYPFYKGPIIFPLIVLSIMVVSSLPAFYRLLIKPNPDASWYLDGKGAPKRPSVVLGLLILFFIFGITYIGVGGSCFLFLSLSLFYLKHRSIKTFIGFSILYTVLIVIVFKYLLDIWFPEPWILTLFGD